MRASVVTKSLTAASANNVAISQTLGGAGNLTLNGSAASGGVATLDTQRRVIITSAGNDSGINWTVIGTDETGNPIKDIFAGGNIAVAQSNIDFLTVTSVSGSGAAAAAVTVGTNTTGSSPWKYFDGYIPTPNMSIDMELLSGSGTATFEYTYGGFLAAPGVASSIANGPASPNPVAVPHPSLQGLTASQEGQLGYAVTGYRLTITLGTGTWRCTTRQAGVATP